MINQCDKCSELIKDLATVGAKVESIDTRTSQLETVYESIRNLAVSTVRLTEQIKNTRDDVTYIKTEINKIQGEKGKKWDTITMLVITSIISLIIGYLFNKLLNP